MTDTIYVYGKRMEDAGFWSSYDDPESGVEPHPTLSPEEGGSGGDEPPTTKLEFSEDATCEEGAAKKIGEYIRDLVASVGQYEFGTYLVRSPVNSYGAHENGVYTNYSPAYAKLPRLLDYRAVRGTVHNHVWNTSTTEPYANHINRYPGPEDWGGLDEMVNPTNGAVPADPETLSVYITDPWGVTREFHYADRALYQQMDDAARIDGGNLPEEVRECPL